MKIIFSRKGVDSVAGQCASAIVDGRPISLPIPTQMPTPTSYGDLAPVISALANDLSRGGLPSTRPCHLDPDIDRNALRITRPPGWRGALGQTTASLSHLRNAGVGPGDLFLFWGLFRECAQHEGKWRYVGPRQHAIFGWLEVDKFVDLGSDGSHVLVDYPWLLHHPHARADWTEQNALFIARELLSFGEAPIPGFGVFQRPIRLTKLDAKMPSIWSVPKWLDPTDGGAGMTYHPPDRWLGNGTVKAAARGQEFVTDVGERSDAREWLLALFRR